MRNNVSIPFWAFCVFAVAGMFFFAVPLTANAATLYWVGGNGDSWNNASDWSTTDPASCNDNGGDASAAPTSSDIITPHRSHSSGIVRGKHLIQTACPAPVSA